MYVQLNGSFKTESVILDRSTHQRKSRHRQSPNKERKVKLSMCENSPKNENFSPSLVETFTQTEFQFCCHIHNEPNIPQRHSVATSTCIEEDDDLATRKRKDEILKDDKKLYLMFGQKDDSDDSYFRNNERCAYYYKTEDRDSKSDLSYNGNNMSPMVLSTSSLDDDVRNENRMAREEIEALDRHSRCASDEDNLETLKRKVSELSLNGNRITENPDSENNGRRTNSIQEETPDSLSGDDDVYEQQPIRRKR